VKINPSSFKKIVLFVVKGLSIELCGPSVYTSWPMTVFSWMVVLVIYATNLACSAVLYTLVCRVLWSNKNKVTKMEEEKPPSKMEEEKPSPTCCSAGAINKTSSASSSSSSSSSSSPFASAVGGRLLLPPTRILEERRRIVKMLIIAVLVFVVGYAPAVVFFALVMFKRLVGWAYAAISFFLFKIK
jgi:hypothetical protein